MDEKSNQLLLILLLISGIILIALLKFIFGRRKSNSVLILGASGAGKTTLFHQLRDGSVHAGTLPSMQPNKDIIVLNANKEGGKERTCELIDIPGHAKVRGTATQFYSAAKAVLFLVDAVDFMAQKTSVAEHLYEVISDPTLQRKGVKLLLVCNKTDEGARAHTADFIRKRLEKELEALRGTRSTLGEGVSKGQPIAKAGEVFTFAGLRSPAVTVVSGSALRADLDELLKHLR